MLKFESLMKCNKMRRLILNNKYIYRINKQFSSNIICSPVEFKIPTPWGHIAGKEWGSNNARPVIAVHGWQDSAATFDTLIPLLNKDLHIYALDMPGHGLSSHIPEGMIYSYFVFMNAIHRSIEYLKLEKFSFLGHSMGAELGFFYASTYPERVSHLISLDSFKPVITDVNILAAAIRRNFLYFLRLEQSKSSPPEYTKEEALEKICSIMDNSITRESAKLLIDRGMISSSDNKLIFRRDPRLRLDMLAFGESNDKMMLYGTNMNCHVLFVKAKPGMDFEPLEIEKCSIEVLRNCLPSLRYEEVSGSHYVHLNSPEIVAPLINQVLNL